MRHWNLLSMDVASRQPEVLHSEGEGRTIVINLSAGEALQDHQVHERAWVVVLAGEVELEAGSETVSGGTGLMAIFDPGERHEVRATQDARLLLLLGPWPGAGHPSQR